MWKDQLLDLYKKGELFANLENMRLTMQQKSGILDTLDLFDPAFWTGSIDCSFC